MNLLEVNGICKTYGEGETAVNALKNVSFSVPKGEFVAVVGEANCTMGKPSEMGLSTTKISNSTSEWMGIFMGNELNIMSTI